MCIYILLSFYTTTTVVTGEGKFDIKMQGFKALKSLKCRSFRGEGANPPGPHQDSALDLTGDLGGPQTPRRTSPPLTPKPGSAPAMNRKKKVVASYKGVQPHPSPGSATAKFLICAFKITVSHDIQYVYNFACNFYLIPQLNLYYVRWPI